MSCQFRLKVLITSHLISSLLLSPSLSFSRLSPFVIPPSDALSTILINFVFTVYQTLTVTLPRRHILTALLAFDSQVESTSRAISIKNGLIEVTLRYPFKLIIVDNSQPDVATSDDNNRMVAVDNNEKLKEGSKRADRSRLPSYSACSPIHSLGLTNGLEYTSTHPRLPTPRLYPWLAAVSHPGPVQLESLNVTSPTASNSPSGLLIPICLHHNGSSSTRFLSISKIEISCSKTHCP
ncbi:hypothetical protein ONZ45_g17035 [Pleurotus djamor]|nr:hypothetical protein ONZ45_g17035 [Pleurotus djamor]